MTARKRICGVCLLLLDVVQRGFEIVASVSINLFCFLVVTRKNKGEVDWRSK